MKKVICISMLCMAFASQTLASYEKEMAAFKKQDADNPPQAGLTLFVGSSTFTQWKTMQADMPEIPLINRGFGGSMVTDVIEHFDTVIAPYNPKQIVIYEGDNDTARGIKTEQILSNYKQLLTMIWEKYPGITVTIISVKPCELRRDKFLPTTELNDMLNVWASQTKNLYYLNTYDITMNGEGDPIPEYFLKDNLHLNANGYKAWARKIVNHLKKINDEK